MATVSRGSSLLLTIGLLIIAGSSSAAIAYLREPRQYRADPPVAQAMGLALMSALMGRQIDWDAIFVASPGAPTRVHVAELPAIDGPADPYQDSKVESETV